MKYIVIFFAVVFHNAYGQQFEANVLARNSDTRWESSPYKKLNAIPPYRLTSSRYDRIKFEYTSRPVFKNSGIAPVIIPTLFFIMGTISTITDGIDSTGAIIGYSGFAVTGTYVCIKINKNKRRR